MKKSTLLALVFAGFTSISSYSDESEESNSADSSSPLDAFKFGLALGFENYKDGFVNEAETIGENRIVRVADSQDQKPSLWLETHYIWDGLIPREYLTHSAPGFYLGVRALGPDSDTFDAFSLGLLWSFKRSHLDKKPPEGQLAESINIGFGPVWHRTKSLASGITEGEPLPEDFQDIQYDKRDEVSWMLMVYIGFR